MISLPHFLMIKTEYNQLMPRYHLNMPPTPAPALQLKNAHALLPNTCTYKR